MSDINLNKRYRRTKESVERDLFQAAISVIEKVGFQGLTVTNLMKEAKAEPPIFYNRYKDMNDFIEKFVRNYDYWLNDSIIMDQKSGTAIENIQYVVTNLIDPLIGNVCMQKLIAWELNDNNFITRRTAQNRDTNSEQLILYFENEFKDCGINFNAATAILIGGIYYLVIHREMGTFNKIDFSNNEGIDLLKTTINKILKKIFEDETPNKLKEADRIKINIATELLKNGVSPDIIERSTGLSEKVIASLIKSIE